jgi:hypothetical protein
MITIRRSTSENDHPIATIDRKKDDSCIYTLSFISIFLRYNETKKFDTDLGWKWSWTELKT